MDTGTRRLTDFVKYRSTSLLGYGTRRSYDSSPSRGAESLFDWSSIKGLSLPPVVPPVTLSSAVPSTPLSLPSRPKSVETHDLIQSFGV